MLSQGYYKIYPLWLWIVRDHQFFILQVLGQGGSRELEYLTAQVSSSTPSPEEKMKIATIRSGQVALTLRELTEELTKPISVICHQSSQAREVPVKQMLANVMPTYTTGCRKD